MLEEKDVAEVVPAEEEVVNDVEVTTPDQEAPQDESVPSTQEVKPEVKDNRPVENVAWEVKRKLDETIPNLQNKIEELTNLVRERQAPQENKPTKAQLLAYASDPSTTVEQRIYAYTEVEKLDRAERSKEYETLVTSTQRKTESENRRGQSANWVAQNFPETVIKDQAGNMLGWNNQSPVLAKINEYMMRDETLRNHPEGFMMAAKAAAFDLGVTPTQNKKIDRTVAQLRKEQKKQLASTGGTRPAETPANARQVRYEKLKEQYTKTGNKDVFAEMLKMRGMNPFAG